ncbi:HDOD domain-containing protein [Arsukibacterium sp.]|uniref:HDOD domain-containing protein n=1 Tax=Arsukibacterium sp. TaxID=1977258 RepID=UPI002FDB140A
MSAQQALLTILQEKIKADRLVLPTLPAIALKVREQAEDPDVSLAQMAEIISQDPALAARMIKVANSAFMGRSIMLNTLQQAVTRIGLSQIKNIAIAMALEQLFVSEYKQVQQKLDQLWRDSVQIAAISVACLQWYKASHPKCRLNKDVMALTALVHNIGALAVLTEAERHQEVFGHPVFLTQVIDKAAPLISMKVLQAWNFEAEFQQAAKTWRLPRPDAEVSYTDFIRLAALSQGFYKAEDKSALIAHYVEQGLVAAEDFMQQQDIQKIYQDVQALFH